MAARPPQAVESPPARPTPITHSDTGHTGTATATPPESKPPGGTPQARRARSRPDRNPGHRPPKSSGDNFACTSEVRRNERHGGRPAKAAADAGRKARRTTGRRDVGDTPREFTADRQPVISGILEMLFQN